MNKKDLISILNKFSDETEILIYVEKTKESRSLIKGDIDCVDMYHILIDAEYKIQENNE